MKKNSFIIILFLLLVSINGFGQAKKFIACGYEEVLQINSIILKNHSLINNIASSKRDSLIHTIQLNLDSVEGCNKSYKLKKKDLLILKEFINSTKLIIYFNISDSNFSNLEHSSILIKKIDLYRDYALASAQIQAQFEKKYQRSLK